MERPPEPIVDKVREVFPSLNGTLEAIILDQSLNEAGRFPISELVSRIESTSGATFLVFDGIITQRLIDSASRAGVKGVVGHRIGELRNVPDTLTVETFRDIGLE